MRTWTQRLLLLAAATTAGGALTTACSADLADDEALAATTGAVGAEALELSPPLVQGGPGVTRHVSAALLLGGAPAVQAVPYVWADAPQGLTVSAEQWPGDEGRASLLVHLEPWLPEGDYQVPVHAWVDGQVLDSTLVVRARALSELAVSVDQQLVPTTPPLPAYPGGPPRPMARVVDERGRPADFVAGELVLASDAPGAVDALLARTGGQVVDTSAAAQNSLPGPTFYLVRVELARAEPARLVDDLRALDPHARGALRVSSPDGVATLALAALAARDGFTVGVNWVGQGDGLVDRKLTDGPNAWWGKSKMGGYTPNAFTWAHFQKGGVQDIGVAEAWRALHLAGKLSKDSVLAAIIDGGFKDYDLPAFTGTSATVLAGAFGDPNPGSCGEDGASCPWHGTAVAQSGFAVADNGVSAAGPGGPVSRLLLVHNHYDIFSNSAVVPAVVAAGARVINMSFHWRVPATLSWSVAPFDRATAFARANRVLVVAAAGNQGDDVDGEDCFFDICWEEAWYAPCENSGVLCVGGLDWNSRWRNTGSNYGGEEVDLFGPFVLLRGFAPDVSFPYPDAGIGAGTSYTSPFVAGVAALLFAANPALSADDVENTLKATASDSPDGSVGRRIINAFAAVRAVLPPVAPTITITAPADGSSPGYGGIAPVSFSATAEDVEDGPDCCTITWSSSVDGVLGTGKAISFAFPSPGLRVITATATDSSGLSRSASVTLHVQNAAPTAQILSPAAMTEVVKGAPTMLKGRGVDPNEIEVPCANLSWRGTYGTMFSATGCTPTVTFTSTGWQGVALKATDAYGLTHETAMWLVVVDSPAGAPVATIVKPAAGGGVYGNNINWLIGSAVDPDGDTALQYRWRVRDYGVWTVLGTTTSTLYAWRPRDRFPSNCGGRTMTLELTVTDSTGKTSLPVLRDIFVNFPPC